ncbi:hypothetical protein V5O48_012141 [Marasmius crinis-equi]|uniref:Chitin synthase export chaperone n=1 Tax=Marasmius crinis-equi TaxID=585013 RepID=A0ABR3F3W6_9AGAR
MASVIPYIVLSVIFFAGTTYVALDVGLGITDTLGPTSNPSELRSIALFVLTSIWPAVAALIYFGLMTYIVLGVLNETRPMWFYILAAGLFVLGQLAWFLLGKVICRGTGAKIDGSFIATILETAAMIVLYFAWRSITEGESSLESRLYLRTILWFPLSCVTTVELQTFMLLFYHLQLYFCDSACGCFFVPLPIDVW